MRESSSGKEQQAAEDDGHREADGQDDLRTEHGLGFLRKEMHVENNEAESRSHVMTERPYQHQKNEFAKPGMDHGRVDLEAGFGRDALGEQIKHERDADEEHQRPACTMQDGNLRSRRHGRKIMDTVSTRF